MYGELSGSLVEGPGGCNHPLDNSSGGGGHVRSAEHHKRLTGRGGEAVCRLGGSVAVANGASAGGRCAIATLQPGIWPTPAAVLGLAATALDRPGPQNLVADPL